MHFKPSPCGMVYFAVLSAICLSAPGARAQDVIFPGQTGQQLRESLVDRYKPAAVFSYDIARDSLFGRVYNVTDSVYCVYTGFAVYIDPASPTAPRTQAFHQDVNTEHTWPQSKGAGSGNARSDLHHLFPTRADVNSSRSNYPFANIPPDHVTRWWRLAANTSETPTSNLEEWSRTNSSLQRFQVRDDHKGRTARSMFYFYTMYDEEADASDSLYFDVQKNTLYEWHVSHPPDSLEIARTQRIATYQDGRENPFVLDTSLVRRAFFEDGPPADIFAGLYTFDGYSSTEPCPDSFPSAFDFAAVEGEYVTFSAFERHGVVCAVVNNAFNSSGWPQTSTRSDQHFIAFSVQASPGSTLNFVPSNLIQFFARRSNMGPHTAAVYLSADGGPLVHLSAFEPTTSGGTHQVQMPELSDAAAVEFRFFGWNATHAGGTLRVDDVYLTGNSDFSDPLSVDIVNFAALKSRREVRFTWTASAKPGSMFSIEQLIDAGAATVGTVDARDGLAHYSFTADGFAPGMHQFRVRHTDVTGAVSHSETISVQIEVPGAYLLEGPYPNPFNPVASFTLAVARPERVRIGVYDALGRRVALLNDRVLQANDQQRFSVDGTDLPSGLYVVRITGESFAESRAVTLLK